MKFTIHYYNHLHLLFKRLIICYMIFQKHKMLSIKILASVGDSQFDIDQLM